MENFGFGYGYKGAKSEPPPPPPPVTLPPPPPPPIGIPLPPLFGPLGQMLSVAPPGHPFDQQPARQTVRLGGGIGPDAVDLSRGPGGDAVVPFGFVQQILTKLEKLEIENEKLLKVVYELNEILEEKNQLRVYNSETVATSTAPAVEEETLPPWRVKKVE